MEIDQKKILLKKTEEFVCQYFNQNTDGHDWWHTYRVWQLAVKISKEEKSGDLFLVEMISLLHDVDDWKLTGNKELINTIQWLNKLQLEKNTIENICKAIKGISYKGANVNETELSIEGKIVQDADRLDAIGAIGIARAFAFGGSKHRPLYVPDDKPVMHTSYEDYKNSKGSTINHFYEKLLLLKNKMNTETAKHIANNRHTIMENYLQQFFNEWNNS
jgi:uncharacterized protein